MDGHRISNLEHALADTQLRVADLESDARHLLDVVFIEGFCIVVAWVLAVVWLCIQ